MVAMPIGAGLLPGEDSELAGFGYYVDGTAEEYRQVAMRTWDELQPPRVRPSFDTALEVLRQMAQVSELPYYTAKIMNAYLGVAFDPHTYILPAAMFQQGLATTTNQKVYGVGFTFYEEGEGTVLAISKIPAGSPAEGIVELGDVIVSINGISAKQTDEMFASFGGSEESELVVENVRGQRTVKLQKKEMVTRNVSSKMLMGPAGRKMGQITLASFEPQTSCAEVEQAGRALLAEGAEGIILDLRENGGGMVQQGQCIIALFVEPGSLVWQEYDFNKKEGKQTFRDPKVPLLFQNVPTATLISAVSISGAELAAAYLKVYGKSITVGEGTFGKGSIQARKIEGGILYANTRGLFYGPDGVSPQKIGVTPDFTVYPRVGQTEPTPEQRERDLYPDAIANTAVAPVNDSLVARNKLLQSCLDQEKSVEAYLSSSTDPYARRVIDLQAVTATALLDCQIGRGIPILRDTDIPSIPARME